MSKYSVFALFFLFVMINLSENTLHEKILGKRRVLGTWHKNEPLQYKISKMRNKIEMSLQKYQQEMTKEMEKVIENNRRKIFRQFLEPRSASTSFLKDFYSRF